MKIDGVAATTISQINASGWDADLVVPAARQITLDHIAETTAGHGIISASSSNLMMFGGGEQ